jgi:hypothetical protein
MLLVVAATLGVPELRSPGNVMFGTGMLAAALSLFAFQVLQHRIPQTVEELRRREVFVGPGESSQGRLRRIIEDLDGWLNHRLQYLLGVIFTLLVFLWFPFRYLGSGVVAFGLAIELVVAFFIGLLAWRMLVTGGFVFELGQQRRIRPQLEHPDRCGGLEPLGNLCLWNALVISAAGAFLGAWIVIGPFTPYASLATAYQPLFTRLLLIPLAIAFGSFFLPLWMVHRAMLASRAERWRDLGSLGKRIDDLAAGMLKTDEGTPPAKMQENAARLKVMREIYDQNRQLPSWPFNPGTLTKFVTAQALPVVGLVSQLAKLPFKNILGIGS